MANGIISTTTELAAVLNAHYLSTSTPPTQTKAGIGTTTPSTGDTDIEIAIPVQSTIEIVDDCDATDWTESADAITEALNTTTFKVQPDGSDDTGLSLGKNGTASAGINYTKTVTSLNATSKILGMWVYILDAATLAKLLSAGTALEIRYGSGSGDYYSRNRTQAQLAVGWNYIVLDVGSPDATTGSPVITAMDFAGIFFTTNNASDTFTSADLIMDSWHLVSSDDFLKTSLSGFPSVNTSTLQAEERYKLGTTDANGFPVTEIATFAATGDTHKRALHDEDSKTSSDIFIYVIQTRYRNKTT